MRPCRACCLFMYSFQPLVGLRGSAWKDNALSFLCIGHGVRRHGRVALVATAGRNELRPSRNRERETAGSRIPRDRKGASRKMGGLLSALAAALLAGAIAMADTAALQKAKKAKNDEFYTQYADIQTEVNAYLEYNPDTFRGKTVLLPCDDPEESNFTRFFAENFTALGLKKLISTSYAPNAKKEKYGLDLFDWAAGRNLDPRHGRMMILDHDVNGDGKINFEDLEWWYLKGDGDFRSDEVKKFRDAADIIVTNPPFSLFREFLAWILEGNDVSTQRRGDAEGGPRLSRPDDDGRDKPVPPRQFLIIGNMNAITYKEVFPLIKANRMWLGESIHSGDREFGVPKEYPLNAAGFRIDSKGNHFIRVKGVRWFTNLEHGRRHQPLQLMTEARNVKYSKHKEIRGVGYRKYDNYDAIEVPFTDAIPSDYDGVMGVPISFLDKYCPEQFEILGITNHGAMAGIPYRNDNCFAEVGGERRYVRIFIRRRGK